MQGHGTLNRIYRLVWSAIHQTWVVASEVSRGRGKKATSRVVAAAFGLGGALLASGLVAPGALATPTGGQVVSGSATISQSGAAGSGTTTITQTTDKTSINWQSFNVGSAETVNFLQPSATALAVNRIFDTQGSQILGRINANGQVWLINPNGVLFGQGAQINVGGLVASTLDTSDATLGQASQRFSGTSTAGVSNFGQINAAYGGYVALLGHNASNQGTITASGGTVALGAGSTVTLSFAGSTLLGLQVDKNLLKALAANGGLIQADGGQVLLSAGARDSVLANVVNNTGVIVAHTAQEKDGRIVLLAGMQAGTAQVAGTLDASAPSGGNGGFVETSAHTVHVADGTQVTTRASHGKTGKWLIDPTDFTISAGSADPSTSGIGASTLQSALAGTDVKLATDSAGTDAGDINVNAAVSWSANKLTLSAANNINVNAALTGSGTAQLEFDYGQGTSTGSTSSYNIHAPVSLPEGQNFTTKQGSDGALVNWTVITRLGSEGSTTGTDLQGVNGGLGGNYVLGVDIDAIDTAAWNGGAGFTPVGAIVLYQNLRTLRPFTGKMDGLGHTISNLTINRPSENQVGLFGYINNNASIQNLGVINVSIWGNSVVGGLVGLNDHGSIGRSYATGRVSGYGSIESDVGGLVGANSGTISASYAAISVVGDSELGGLVGINSGTISNSYATGGVSGGFFLAGLVGDNEGLIDSSYATGRVSGGFQAGGLVGITSSGTIKSSYFDSFTTGQISGVGHGAANGVKGLSSDPMKQSANFAGWDFSSTGAWVQYDGHTAPLLRSFLTPLTVTTYATGSKVYDGTSACTNGITCTASYTTSNGKTVFGSASTALGNPNAGVISATGSGLFSDQQGYLISYVPASSATITPRPVTVNADSKTKTYGDANPALTYTVAPDGTGTSRGLVAGDSLSGSLTIASTTPNAAGTYANAIDASALANGNYVITANNGTLTIDKRAVTVSADNKTKTYGDANPTLTYTVAADGTGTSRGLVNGDSLGSLSTLATASSPVNTYTIDASTLANGNYLITANNGTLTIDKRAVTVSAGNKTKTYGDANPALTYTVAPDGTGTSRGLVAGDSLSGSLTIASTTPNAAGTYANAIDASALANGNYVITANNGTLTIDKRAVTVSADNKTKTYGDANPVLTYTVAPDGTGTSRGLVDGDSLGSLRTLATASSPESSYTIDASSLANGNYLITANNGTLTIKQLKIYREASPLAYSDSSANAGATVGALSQTFASTRMSGVATLQGVGVKLPEGAW